MILKRLLQKFERDTVEYPTTRHLEVNGYESVFYVTNNTEDNRISQFGGEKEQLVRFINSIDSNSIVWDVGANVGLYSVFAARAGGTVYAFEPEPSFADHLRKNVDLNGQDVHVLETGLSDESGERRLYTDGIDGLSPSLAGDDRKTIMIDISRGDELEEIPSPDVLKIDVEGAEVEVLRGMNGIIDSISTVFVELHPEMIADFGDKIDDAEDIMDSHGFKLQWKANRDEQIHTIFSR